MPPKVVPPIERWLAEAEKHPAGPLKIPVPFHVLLAEAVDLARFHARYFKSVEAKDGQPARPGLDTVIDEERGLTAKTGEEILSIRDALQEANTRYLLAASPSSVAPMKEATFIIDEISSVLEYLFDDGVEDERDAQLDAVEAASEGAPDTIDAKAAELENYVGLGNAYRKEIDGLGGFDVKLLDRGPIVAKELRERPATPEHLPEEAKNALALRNRFALLLWSKMSVVRNGARFVFRHHPEIVREATSAYERRRRAAARRKAMKKAPKAPE